MAEDSALAPVEDWHEDTTQLRVDADNEGLRRFPQGNVHGSEAAGGRDRDSNPVTLRWQAYLMVPAFVTKKLVEEARRLAKAKHPESPYEAAALAAINEGYSVQMLHVGRYDREQPILEELHAYASAHGLAVTGKHHEIYISDPRRTKPEKLKTVIRFGVKPAVEQRRAPGSGRAPA